MLHALDYLPYLFAQAYGRGFYGGSRYQAPIVIGPFILPSVGSALTLTASVIALVAGVTLFVVLTLKRRRQVRTLDSHNDRIV